MGGICCINGTNRIIWYMSTALYTVRSTYRAAMNNTALLELQADMHDFNICSVFGRSCCNFPVIFYWESLRPGSHYPYVVWAHVILRVQLGCERRFNIEFYGAGPHVTLLTSRDLTWSSGRFTCQHVSHICCCTHFVRREVREVCSSGIVTSCFQKLRECLLKKCSNGPLSMTPTNPNIQINIWQPTHWKGQGRSWK